VSDLEARDRNSERDRARTAIRVSALLREAAEHGYIPCIARGSWSALPVGAAAEAAAAAAVRAAFGSGTAARGSDALKRAVTDVCG
jgi:hypothetical protein